MIETLILAAGITLIAVAVSYALTILPFFWAVLLKYVDKKIKEEVEAYLEKKLKEKIEKIERLDEEIRSRQETINQLKSIVGRKLEKDKISPIGENRIAYIKR